ncbi:glycoside hydrolase family 16 protein [Pontibacter sp. CAU 1760]
MHLTNRILFLFALAGFFACSPKRLAYRPSVGAPVAKAGYELVWHDEFNTNGRPDSANWQYEHGFVRNNELQWYQQDNAHTQGGVLVIEGRREQVRNHRYERDSEDWRRSRAFADYTSASINTRGSQQFRYGLIEVRARIDTTLGMWPAIWTLGVSERWPANGEVDIMEYYRVNEKGTILANAAWANERMNAVWDDAKIPITYFTDKDPDWPRKFHTWKMDWTENYIRLYLDEELLNEIDLTKTHNADGYNPFRQPHYLLLNLAIGSNGGDPSETSFPRRYEVDYVRVFQKK